MKLLILGKAPPVEGGVSAQTFWLARALAARGHSVDLVSNATEVEPGLAQFHYGEDAGWLDRGPSGLRLHRTTPLRAGSFTPFAQPFASKLIGLTHGVMARDPCDAILGWYYEPYGVAAAAIGQASGTPYVLRHAGSDIGRLARHPDLGAAYRWALEGAAALVVTNEREMRARWGAVSRPRIAVRRPRLPDVFSTAADDLDVAELAAEASAWFSAAGLGEQMGRWQRQVAERPPPQAPAIGVYGKVGVAKGSFDLVAALTRLAEEGESFSFLSLSCGSRDVLAAYYTAIQRSPALVERTWPLPPVAPWRIPGFLRVCDAVCFLEREFPIPFHGPLIPREILASGACLVCSAEVAEKPANGGNLVDERNAIVIGDPRDHDELAGRIRTALAEPTKTAAIGRQGQLLARFLEEELPDLDRAAGELVAGIEGVIG